MKDEHRKNTDHNGKGATSSHRKTIPVDDAFDALSRGLHQLAVDGQYVEVAYERHAVYTPQTEKKAAEGRESVSVSIGKQQKQRTAMQGKDMSACSV